VKIATTTRTLYKLKSDADSYIVDEKGESKKVSKGHVSTSKITAYSTKAESDAKAKEIKDKKVKDG
jgi:hypothetical protein